MADKIINIPSSYERRWYSKTHRRQYIHTSWLERLGEIALQGVADQDPKGFKLTRAILNHLEANQDFYKEAI
ncbi:hypothetical protein LCGC14_1200780 [marine sediment metagenome]|uniref:Uncharacterized protein n=2 Tax=marine sediment metagenome TaxID=412755 RepID=A0A0F9LH00_9ZZZZ